MILFSIRQTHKREIRIQMEGVKLPPHADLFFYQENNRESTKVKKKGIKTIIINIKFNTIPDY